MDVLQDKFLEEHGTLMDEDVNNIISTDMLAVMCPNLDGMAYKKSWGYYGGQGVAGAHFEDGLLHFGHHMIQMVLNVDWDPVAATVFQTLQCYSRKTWVFYNIGGPNGAIKLNQFIGEDLWELPKQEVLVDELLVARSYILDPRVFASHPDFEVKYQYDGEFMYGDAGHSVLGCGAFSYACNFAMPAAFQSYIMAEKILADAVRKCSRSYIKLRGKGVILRTFVFVSAMIFYVMGKGKDANDMVKDWVTFCFRADRMKPHLTVRTVDEEEDDYATPVNENDSQCEICGHSYITTKYHVVAGKKMLKVGMCCECVAVLGMENKVAKVPLFTTTTARAIGLNV